MGDAADDYGLHEDEDGYGYCPHVEDYGYCMGNRCRPLDTSGDEEDTSDVEIDSPYSFFQRLVDKVELPPPSQASVDLIAKAFGVPAEYVGKTGDHAADPVRDIQVMASKHVPKDTSYVFAMDPAAPESGMVVMVDEASQILGNPGRATGRPAPERYAIDCDGLKARFPSYVAWAAKYTNVPQINNNPREYTMDMAGIAAARRDLEEMLAKVTKMVAVVERFGGEPGEGTVIKFEHTFDNGGLVNDGKVYDYAAVRKFGKWYVTGRPFVGQAISWSKLLEFIGDGRAWVCREFEEVPVPGASAATDADTKAAVTHLLANSGGREPSDVAEELLNLMGKKD